MPNDSSIADGGSGPGAAEAAITTPASPVWGMSSQDRSMASVTSVSLTKNVGVPSRTWTSSHVIATVDAIGIRCPRDQLGP